MRARIDLIAVLTSILAVLLATTGTAAADEERPAGPTQATTLLDLSGLAPVGPGLLIGVHDAKTPDEDDRPRASLLTLTGTPDGVTWEPIAITWPKTGPSNDLESATSIPGEASVILAESGDDGGEFQRLFLVAFDAMAAGPLEGTVSDVIDWPEPVFNVESVAVARVGDGHLLLWAERAQGDPTTRIRWAPLTISPFAVGSPVGADFTSPAVRGPNDRPVSAMEVGPEGRIYVASAFDSGDDDGPFSSTVWVAGWVLDGQDGPTIIVASEPEHVATLDGFKVESVAFVDGDDGSTGLYVGTDDENLGGVLRPLVSD